MSPPFCIHPSPAWHLRYGERWASQACQFVWQGSAFAERRCETERDLIVAQLGVKCAQIVSPMMQASAVALLNGALSTLESPERVESRAPRSLANGGTRQAINISLMAHKKRHLRTWQAEKRAKGAFMRVGMTHLRIIIAGDPFMQMRRARSSSGRRMRSEIGTSVLLLRECDVWKQQL